MCNLRSRSYYHIPVQLGFIVDLTILLNLYNDLKLQCNFEYILSFKLSQDHLETFFSAIRSRGGHCNLSCLQFKAAYKKLVVKHEISGSKYGNFSILDAANILHVSSSPKAKTTDAILKEDLDLILDEELILIYTQAYLYLNLLKRL